MDLIWRLFGALPLERYEPAAVAAVLVATDPQGRVARYPLYGQIAEARLSERIEVANTITLLHEWQTRLRPVAGGPSCQQVVDIDGHHRTPRISRF